MDGRTDRPTDETIFGREKKKKGGIMRQKREGTVCSDTKPLKKSVFLALSIMHVFRRILFKILFSIISKRAQPTPIYLLTYQPAFFFFFFFPLEFSSFEEKKFQKNGFPILPFFKKNLQESLKNRFVSIHIGSSKLPGYKKIFWNNSYLVCSQMWLNLLVVWSQMWQLHHRIERNKNTA